MAKAKKTTTTTTKRVRIEPSTLSLETTSPSTPATNILCPTLPRFVHMLADEIV